jgi:regulatory protein
VAAATMTEDREQMPGDTGQNFSTFAKTSRQKAMNTAVRILTNRDHSKYELKQKLKQRGFESEVIGAVMAACERLDYINDPRTAHLYILQLKRKCFGKRYIRMALKKKRLTGAVVENLLLENYSEADERENAVKMLEKKRETVDPEADLKKRREKLYRFLYSRGFSKDLITNLILHQVK